MFRPASKMSLQRRQGFTLIEILVVIAILAFLASLLLPVCGAGKSKGRRTACVNNLKQLAVSTQMYAADNDGRLAGNLPAGQGTNAWVQGNMTNLAEASDQELIRQGKLFPYASQTALYHCPSDLSRLNGLPRVRSYSMNSWMGSRYMEQNYGQENYRTFVRESELSAAGPARLWSIIDEHEVTIDDAWFLVTMNDSAPFASFPATRHERAYVLNFADGHVESYKLRDPNSIEPALGSKFTRQNADWLRLKQITTVP